MLSQGLREGRSPGDGVLEIKRLAHRFSPIAGNLRTQSPRALRHLKVHGRIMDVYEYGANWPKLSTLNVTRYTVKTNFAAKRACEICDLHPEDVV